MPRKNITKKEKKIVDDLWEYTKQANMQSDNVEMSSDGIQYTGDFKYSYADLDDDLGTGTIDTIDPGYTFSYDNVGQLDMFDEMDMRDKYPALNQAWEHYQSILEVCKTKEKEENED